MAKLTVVRIERLAEDGTEASPPEGSHVVSLNSLPGRHEGQFRQCVEERQRHDQNHREAAIVYLALSINGRRHWAG